jgi:hypothetical protein
MKIFQINCDSVAAESLEEAQRYYDEHPNFHCPIDPALADEVEDAEEIPEDRLKRMTFFCEGTGFRGTMWEYLQQLIADGQKFPCIFGCSEC